MNEEQNKTIVKRFIEEMWNQRKLQVADELFAADCVTHQLRSGEDPAGIPRSAESVKREAAAWLTGFPDLEFLLEQMIAGGDRVVSHWSRSSDARFSPSFQIKEFLTLRPPDAQRLRGIVAAVSAAKSLNCSLRPTRPPLEKS